MTFGRAASYFLREAASDLWRRRTVNVVSIAAIAASIYVVGLFILLTVNVGHLIASWAEENRMSVFISDSIAESERTRIERTIAGSPVVTGHEVVSKAQALERFRREFPDLADLALGLDENPLPASFEITLRSGEQAGGQAEDLATKLSSLEGVEGVRYDRAWVRRIRSLVGAVGLGGAFLGTILLSAAVITIYGVIRLNVQARRQEIEILRLVGATRGFIRGPFLVEGAFQGAAASILAVVMLAVTWLMLHTSRAVKGDMLLESLVGGFLPLWAPPALLAIGLAIGLVGSLLSVRRVFTTRHGTAAPGA